MIRYVKLAHLPVFDQSRALAFYTEKVGLRVAQDRPFMAGLRWIELEVPGARTHIWFAARPDDEPAREPSLVLMVDDVDAQYRSLADAGVDFVQAPAPAPWSPGESFAMFRDPEGNLVLVSPAV